VQDPGRQLGGSLCIESPEGGLRTLVPEEFHQCSLQPTLLLVFLDGGQSPGLKTEEASALESNLKGACEGILDSDDGIVKSGNC
jgi:hypothetical protein